MKTFLKIVGVVAVIMWPMPYLYILDNAEQYKLVIKILGFIGYSFIGYQAFVAIFKRRPFYDD